MGASVPCFLHPDKEGSGRVGAGIRPSLGPAFPSSSHLSLPGRGLCPHEPLGQVPADRPWYEPGTAQDDHPEPSPTDPRPCCRPLPFPQVLDVPLTVKLRTGVQERVNLAHRLLPDLRDWGAALVTVGLGAQWASGPRGTSLSNYPSLPSPLSWSLARPPSLVSVCPSLCLSLSQSVSPGFSGSLSLSLAGPLLPRPLLPSPHGRLSSSSMAARGSSATPSWPTGSTSSSAWQQPAPCPFSVGPHRSHTQAHPSPGPLPAPMGGSRLARTPHALAPLPNVAP